MAAILVSQTEEIIKILLLRAYQHGRHDVRLKPAIVSPCNERLFTLILKSDWRHSQLIPFPRGTRSIMSFVTRVPNEGVTRRF